MKSLFNGVTPKMFLTDDSDAEREALSCIFPNARVLFCAFHILQALWRWLLDKKHDVHKDDAPKLLER